MSLRWFSMVFVTSALMCAVDGQRFAFMQQKQGRANERMTLDVYYESLCPDSRNFLVNQLEPNWKNMSPYTDLRLIPFGKATYTANPAGGWIFTCQHGNDECIGNILHACGIKYSTSTSQALAYAVCLMRAPGSGAACASLAGIDFAPVEACTKGLEGQNLHQVNGDETLNSLNPTLTFVPWVIYNKVWEDSNQWDSLKNIMTVACKYAPAGSNGCSKLIGK